MFDGSFDGCERVGNRRGVSQADLHRRIGMSSDGRVQSALGRQVAAPIEVGLAVVLDLRVLAVHSPAIFTPRASSRAGATALAVPAIPGRGRFAR